MTDVIMPQMGESIAEGTITKWMKNVGDRVQRDEPLFEISTDKVDAEIPAPASGVLKEIRVEPGATVPINTVVAVIAEGEGASVGSTTSAFPAVTAPGPAPAPPLAPAAPSAPSSPTASSPAPPRAAQPDATLVPGTDVSTSRPGTPAPSAQSAPSTPSAPSAPSPPPASPAPPSSTTQSMAAVRPSAAPAGTAAPPAADKPRAEMTADELRQTRSSPVVRKIAAEHNVDIRQVAGTGIAGRVTKQDILDHIETRPGAGPTPPAGAAPAPAPPTAAAPPTPPAPPAPATTPTPTWSSTPPPLAPAPAAAPPAVAAPPPPAATAPPPALTPAPPAPAPSPAATSSPGTMPAISAPSSAAPAPAPTPPSAPAPPARPPLTGTFPAMSAPTAAPPAPAPPPPPAPAPAAAPAPPPPSASAPEARPPLTGTFRAMSAPTPAPPAPAPAPVPPPRPAPAAAAPPPPPSAAPSAPAPAAVPPVAAPAPPAARPTAGPGAPPPGPGPVPFVPPYLPGERVEIVPMSPIRKKTAEHMVMSKRISAHVTTVSHVDMTRVAQLRDKYRPAYQDRAQIKLTYMPFIVKATVDALKAFPVLNAAVDGDSIVYKKEFNVGMAVALDWGLIVPVVRNADEKNVLGLARSISDLAERARGKKLKIDEVQGGTFTITNPGVFGSLFGTPVINQPQVGILGVGTIEKRPIVRDDAIAIRTMCYFALSFDHRIVDGAEADRFMAHLKKGLQEFDESAL